jgi:hypothetical protein
MSRWPDGWHWRTRSKDGAASRDAADVRPFLANSESDRAGHVWEPPPPLDRFIGRRLAAMGSRPTPARDFERAEAAWMEEDPRDGRTGSLLALRCSRRGMVLAVSCSAGPVRRSSAAGGAHPGSRFDGSVDWDRTHQDRVSHRGRRATSNVDDLVGGHPSLGGHRRLRTPGIQHRLAPDRRSCRFAIEAAWGGGQSVASIVHLRVASR